MIAPSHEFPFTVYSIQMIVMTMIEMEYPKVILITIYKHLEGRDPMKQRGMHSS